MTGDRWDSWPSRASQDYFVDAMAAHTQVERMDSLSPSRYDLRLVDGTEVKVFMTDVYTFSASDYALLKAKHPDVTCIVSASNWNHFSDQAREDAAADGVATFHFADLMGALHYRGDGFVNYSGSRG